MVNITLLGTGAMGSLMALRLLKAGYSVTVWNRTRAGAEKLSAAGAKVADTPREAVAQASLVISMVRDDQASHDVWLNNNTGALAGMPPQAIAIESSTLSVGWVRTLAAEMAARKLKFVEAPVSGSRPQASAGTLVWFAGGDQEVIATLEPVLLTMGSVVYHTGSHGSAALTKLATNSLMGVQVTALAEIIGILQHQGADVARILQAVSGTSAWSPLAGGISGLMIAKNYQPQFPAELIEKDFGYTLQLLSEGKTAPTLTGARSVFRQAIDSDMGADNMSGVVRLFEKKSI